MTRTLIASLAAGLCAAVLLSACGGGNDAPTPPPGDGLTESQRDDRSASASVAGLFAFASKLIATMTGDAAEPRSIDGVTPPTSETDEPAPLPG